MLDLPISDEREHSERLEKDPIRIARVDGDPEIIVALLSWKHIGDAAYSSPLAAKAVETEDPAEGACRPRH